MMINILKTKKGYTLIEVLVTLSIFTMVVVALYPILNTSFTFSNEQIKEVNYRNDVRVASSYLTEDIKGSEAIAVETNKIIIEKKNGEMITYRIDDRDFIRELGNRYTKFEYIKDVNFELKNEDLVVSKFFDEQNMFTSFSVYSGEVEINLRDTVGDNDEFKDFMFADNVFVFSNYLNLNGNVKIDGPTSTIVVNENFNDKGNINVTVKNMFVNSNDIPRYSMPRIELDSWYNQREYNPSSSNFKSNTNYIVGNWDKSGNYKVDNVIIVSKRDINLRGNIAMTGVLFAPNGKVSISGNVKFEGIIIANEVEVRGNANIKYSTVETLPFE